ncbi:hypothetical protein CBR_g3494 [Chara braunii]|uniref:BTB domain-containing protein n=1 Tax=Chara braunii TaxID=69332 RepID=A0A388JR43_CHABU|nr:hypothetical protein CBR_g3494 [Chara braunii]|eukprot:GBG60250.1 hypothetical protein CBR_g3494 [Chara braunii]
MAGGAVTATAAAMGQSVRSRASRESIDLSRSSLVTEVPAPPSPMDLEFAFPGLKENGKAEGDGTGAVTPSLPASVSPPPSSSVASVIPSGMEVSWNRAAGMKSDFVVQVGDVVFNVHKFPLYSKTEYFAAIAVHDELSRKTFARLDEVPGGASTFLLVVNYCYGFDIEITVNNVAALRCAAEYLEMKTESRAGLAREGNLMMLTDTTLQRFLSYWSDAVAVLHRCEPLVNTGEGSEIVQRCVTAIAKACQTTSIAKDSTKREASLLATIPTHESVLSLPLTLYVKIVEAMYVARLPASAIGASVEAYCRLWLANGSLSATPSSSLALPLSPAADHTHTKAGGGSIAPGADIAADSTSTAFDASDCEWLAAVTESASSSDGPLECVLYGERESQLEGGSCMPVSRLPRQEVLRYREIVEALTDLLPEDKRAVRVSTLLKLLRCSVLFDASSDVRQRLERMAGARLDDMDIEDLNLIGTDVEEFLALIRAFNAAAEEDLALDDHSYGGNDLSGTNSCGAAGDRASVKKVAALIDDYLLRAVNNGSWHNDSEMLTGGGGRGGRPLSAEQFMALAESVPPEMRVSHDDLFKAVMTWASGPDHFLSAAERRDALPHLCNLIDPSLLSQAVAERAATMWDSLPLPFIVQILASIKAHLREVLDKQLTEFRKVETEFHHAMEEKKGMEADLAGLRLKRMASDDTLAGMKRAMEEEAREMEHSVRELEGQIEEMQNRIRRLHQENEEFRTEKVFIVDEDLDKYS